MPFGSQEESAAGCREHPASPCPRADVCGLSSVIHSRVALLLWRRTYCESENRFGECHRFRMAARGEPFPAELLPNGQVACPPVSPA